MMSLQDFQELCNVRRSVRYFDVEPVTKKEIEDVLSVGITAPSIENIQPWMFHVVTNPAKKEELMKASCYGNFTPGASALVIVGCDDSLAPKTGNTLWNPRELEYSCVSAMENVLLAAAAMGIGACWVSLHHGTAHDILQLPRSMKVVGGLMLGKLKKGEESPSTTHQRKSLSEVVTWVE